MTEVNLTIDLSTNDELLTVFSKQEFSHQTQLDITSIKKTWSELRGGEDINQILVEYKVRRQDIYRSIGQEYAIQVEKDAIYDILKGAMDYQIPLTMTVGNEAVIQSSKGVIHQVNSIGDWISIFDGEATMHIQEALIHNVWIIKKPSISGMVISVEIFDCSGRVVAIFCGSDEAGSGYCKWRKLLDQVGVQSSV